MLVLLFFLLREGVGVEIVLLSFSECSVVVVYFDGSCGLLCGLLLLFVLF